MILIQLKQFYSVTDWAVSRKRIDKHIPKHSRIDAHCCAMVRVLWFTARSVTLTVESRYPQQWIIKSTATEGRNKINCREQCHIFGWLKCYEKRQKSDVRIEVFILCGVVTVTFRVLSLFVVMTCYNYSRIESVIINCSSAWWISNKSICQSKPVSKVANTCDNIIKWCGNV
jgi:hypothetical protein